MIPARASSQSASHGCAGAGATDLRILLVGNTGLDQTLRRETGVELLRARNSFEAVGELGSPIDAQSPSRTVVIVAPGTVTPEELLALSGALRRVEPDVCIVGLLDSPQARNAAPPPERFGLNAWVVPPVSAGVLRLLVASVTDGASPNAAASAPMDAAPEPAPAPPAQESPGIEAIPAPQAPIADHAPLAAILGATDLVTACLSVIRARPGMESCAFIASTAEAPALATHTDPSTLRVAVIHRGHTFGTLTGPARGAQPIREAADWMALWLALREQQSQLRRAAFTDPLTGAWNRRYFDGFLARSIAEARNTRRDLTMLLFDIDNFKHYNDRFGHGAGDEILTETVRLLKSVVRANDRVCRIGGDEFAVLFQDRQGNREPAATRPASILDLAKRFQQQIARLNFPKLGDSALGTLTISGGLATYPWDGHDAETLMNHADSLLRDSKTRGKNVIRIGPGAMRALGTDESESPQP